MSNTYRKSGVNIEAGNEAVQLMRTAVEATYNADVLSKTGNFGGLFAATALQAMKNPVLVTSIDGVGTKTKVAASLDRWDTIGQDLVNHCVNDILVQGARPLFFLDYIGTSQLKPEQIAAVVQGVAQACQAVGCALIGGETAEMPGVYVTNELDLVGTIIGTVDRDDIIDGSRIQAGDVIIGLPSTGLHTNGFTLARSALATLNWKAPREDLNGASIGETFLNVHRSYLTEIERVQAQSVDIRGLAHITGGGVIDNLPRILPDNCGAIIEPGTWDVPPIFTLIQETDNISDAEMRHVFNMGLGMLMVVPADQVSVVQNTLPDDATIVGQIIDGDGITFGAMPS